MSEHIIKATGRNVEGKGASRRLRRAASIPAIIYGGKADPQPVQLEHEKVWLASQNEWFYSSILTLDVDGKTESVLLRDMQRHPYKQIIMHLDFQRVDANQAIRVAVPLHFLNEDKSPAGKAADVVVTHELNEVEVSCLPKDLPEFLEIDLSALAVGDIVHLSEIKLPKGVEIPELKLGKEHDVAIVIAKHGKEEVEAPAEAPAEVPAAKVSKKDDDKK
ncbi:50S ribosomal protein L25/general stress protein Ctc [Lysobacter sp. 5GHs7-4]|uniref:50S ribosomal protein L25/general stress protein Ctc n=1 Tax=Lysobacter sp. 5GHs7-4 TaxID=2904253 RepID=UPI0017F79ED3|nr:50S ribosomal protein L25/general stress protein Ctc [Lysobacter sp. 5GHs7-4]NUO78082.1 50S ribosomal protein L25/general stress protein Ctc [Lysobacter sp.]UHQ24352.1 50S ribosomal protein L25/general stress protein Ctc [Lysobacter sp. 5GHs7-4]